MTIKILIDLSHNEQINSFPEQIFRNSDFFFDFTRPTDDLSEINLNQYNLIILGNPKPRKTSEMLFKTAEIIKLKEYVKKGGNLLITSGARGDYNLGNKLGSLRAFYKITGIIQYHYSILFHMSKKRYFEKKTNLIINKFPKHPIFDGFNNKDKIIFAKSTYFTLVPGSIQNIILHSPEETDAHDYLKDEETTVGKVPILVLNEYYKGRVVVVGASEFLKKNESNGFEAGSNRKFIFGLMSWLLKKKIS